jgi:hypothetical protein
MDLSDLLPPSDLLERARGVEAGLRRRKQLGRIGWFGFALIAAIQISLAVWKLAVDAGLFGTGEQVLLENWPIPVALALTILFLLLGTWSTFWLRESRQPFRYTCSVSPFVPIGGEAARTADGVAECMTWLSYDITRLLNERVQRFLFADEQTVPAAEPKTKQDVAGDEAADSYIHIHGHYGVRSRPDAEGGLEIEIMPRVRIGAAGQPELMARSVQYALPRKEPKLERGGYQDLLEQVYHAIVTEVYQQLKDDVQRKIELLPTRRFRLIALLQEADDYAHSNSLHAYKEAQELYSQAAATVDPTWRERPVSAALKVWWYIKCRVHAGRTALRKLESHYRPAVAEIDLLCARALIGYARMLSFRRPLSGLLGMDVNTAYEALPVAQRARDRIEAMSPDVSDRRRLLFDAEVTLALVHVAHLSDAQGIESLERARACLPQRAESDAVFLYASGLLSGSPRTRLGLFRRAIEFSPRFEVVQFSLALELEMLWRSRPELERSVLEQVLLEYKKLRQINPGNLGAWANSGYIRWLMGTPDDLNEARTFFEEGKRFKAVMREIVVAELDYGLARIYAESGDLIRAYDHYIAATSAMLARDAGSFREYFFSSMTPATIERFERYQRNVVAGLREDEPKGQQPDTSNRKRLRDSVHAFVSNDLGEAYLYASRDLGEASEHAKRNAELAFRSAVDSNPNFALPYYNLADPILGYAEPLRCLRRVIELQPSWPPGQLSLAQYYGSATPNALPQTLSMKAARDRIASIEAELDALTNRERQHVRYVRSLEASVGAAAAPEALESSPSNQREELEKELERLKNEARDLQSKVEESTRLAKEYRAEAQNLTRALLPHSWFWQGGDVLQVLNDPILRAELRWERQFTDTHVAALFAWTLSYVFDRQDPARAVVFLQHIREHFWPANRGVLYHWVTLSLQTAQDAVRKRAIAREALKSNPLSIIDLRDIKDAEFSEQERIDYLTRAMDIARLPADKRALRGALIAVYKRVIQNAAPGAQYLPEYRRLVELQPDEPEPQYELAAQLEEAQRESRADLLPEAIASARAAVRLAPAVKRYGLQLDRLNAKAEFVAAQQQIEYRFGPGARELVTGENPLIVQYSSSLESVFRPESTPEKEAQDQSLQMLKDGLFYELGVQFPPVAFRRAKDAMSGTYTIRLWDIPFATKELRADRWLFGVSADVLRSMQIPAEGTTNPANGNVASWVSVEHVPQARAYAEKNSINRWNPFECVVLHVASVLRQKALDFLRVDDVVKLLNYWGLQEEGAKLREEGLLLEFTNTLRALVADQFRIAHPGGALVAFRESYVPSESLTATVERMRVHLDLRKQSSFFRSSETSALIKVGGKFEAEIRAGLRVGDGKVLALEPYKTQELLATIRNFVADLPSSETNAFLLCDFRLRPWIRKLVELEFPNFRVVSESEVLPEGTQHVTRALEFEEG